MKPRLNIESRSKAHKISFDKFPQQRVHNTSQTNTCLTLLSYAFHF